MTPIRCLDGASTARSFVQLAKRRYSTAPLDFLVPRGAFNSSRLRIADASTRTSPVPRLPALSIPRQPSVRSFTASSIRLSTECIQNALKDEDGNDMTVEITPRAAKRLAEIMVKDKNPNLALRIQVESGGCHGFQYLMSLITIPPGDAQASSSIINEDDSIFQYVSDEADPATAQQQGPRIILDEPSLELLKGSKVDFTRELIGSQFKIVDNPLGSVLIHRGGRQEVGVYSQLPLNYL